MNQKLLFLSMILSFAFANGQKKSIDDLLEIHNSRSVPYLSVQELKMNTDNYIILDTRLKAEYEVSHLPNAIWAGTNYSKADLTTYINSNKPIVVYCTVGIRSEDFGEKIIRKNNQTVFNLYGGIFAWKDAGYSLKDSKNKTTMRVHTFSKNWEDYLKTGIPVH
ncbi:rhodanese-like domain-containing protein [Leeuwenhoekiella aequorea]|uniref:rhodanese-like domain-containing protein n=1 Tax=Leeuwenhoekiella aequorea TaxID=283736 RepID=UPI00352D83E1